MTDGGGMLWIVTGIVALAAILTAVAVVRLAVSVQQFLGRATKTLDQVDLLMKRKDEEVGALLERVTLASERIETIVAAALPAVTVMRKLVVTANEIGGRGAKAVNSLVSRFLLGLVSGSKREKGK